MSKKSVWLRKLKDYVQEQVKLKTIRVYLQQEGLNTWWSSIVTGAGTRGTGPSCPCWTFRCTCSRQRRRRRRSCRCRSWSRPKTRTTRGSTGDVWSRILKQVETDQEKWTKLKSGSFLKILTFRAWARKQFFMTTKLFFTGRGRNCNGRARWPRFEYPRLFPSVISPKLGAA